MDASSFLHVVFNLKLQLLSFAVDFFLFFLDFYGNFSRTPYFLILKLDNLYRELIGLVSCGILIYF